MPKTISHSSKLEDLTTSYESLMAISTLMLKAHKAINSYIILHLPNANKGDGNLASIFAAINYLLTKSNNLLIILPKRYSSYRGPYFADIFRVTTSRFLLLSFWDGGSKVYSFEPYKYLEFATYLEIKAFNDYSHIRRSVVDKLKFFLFHLFENASHHGYSSDPIFICSSCRNSILKFTITNCGQGFFKNISQFNSKIINEEEAIILALEGNFSSGTHASGCLNSLMIFCIENGGSLIIVSGSALVKAENVNRFSVHSLPGPFRGAIISLSIKV